MSYVTLISGLHWERTPDRDGHGFEVIFIRCPSCRKESTLWSTLGGHAIRRDGEVSPSVVCPFPPCTFHEFVRLDGWTHGDRQRVHR